MTKTKKDIQGGEIYEKLVEKVYTCYYLLNYQKKDFYIKRNYKVADLENADCYFKNPKNKQELNNIKNTELADVYFSYTDDNDNKIETYVECKSGNFQKKEIEKECITKLDKFGIKNVNKIVAFQCEEKLKEEVKEFCQENNIKLWNIEQMIHEIENRILFCLPPRIDILFGIDKKFYKDDAEKIVNDMQGIRKIDIKIEGVEYNFLEKNFKIYDFFNKLGFEKNKIDDKKATYTKQSDNMYVKETGTTDYIKCKKIIFTVTEAEPFETKFTTTIDDSDSLAYIKDIITGKKEIVFESGKIEEKV